METLFIVLHNSEVDLNEVSVYVKVVEKGSFSAAARELGMPNSTVSAKISSLEKRLGVTLIRRTTRKLNVTAAGEGFYRASLRGLHQLKAAESELALKKGEPRGWLRITAPVELGAAILPPLIAQFLNTYPLSRVDVHLSDERVDLLHGPYDLAIRAGELKDSSLIAKKLGQVTFAAFASPKYLKSVKPLKDPLDLKDKSCIQFAPLGGNEWKLTNGKSTRAVQLPGRLVLNDLNMVKAMTIDGHGIALLPSFFCDQELRSGRLEHVLESWRTGFNPVHFVYPAQKFVLPAVSAFIKLSSEPIRQRLSGHTF